MEKKNEGGKGKNREEKSRRGNRRRGEVIQGGEGKEEGISGGMTGGKKKKKDLGKSRRKHLRSRMPPGTTILRLVMARVLGD